MKDNPKIAIVHDWLTGMRGGEKALEVLCELYPDATLFTLVHKKGSVSETIERMRIETSMIQKMPGGIEHYQHYLPLYPAAVKNFNLREYDLVISSSHAAAKAVTVRRGAVHICYCYTPMRYIWDQYDQYFGKDKAPLYIRMTMKMIVGYLREWDKRTAQHVGHFIAISTNVQERIQRIYNREAFVIYPPVDINRFKVEKTNKGFYLIVAALVPYKRVDIAVRAFTKLNQELVVIGKGSELKDLQSIAGKTIKILGWVDDNELARYYAECKAFVFPGEEDFGIVPVEAMASGKPVIAYGKGGLLETVVEGRTGIFFHEQTPESLIAAVQKFQTMNLDPEVIRSHAVQFDRAIFKKRMESFIRERWEERKSIPK
ncbi:MAG: glycosyltransferase [Bacteroidota bacterium]